MMLVSPQKFFGTLFRHFKHPKDQNSSMSKIDFLEKNDTFVRYCPSMITQVAKRGPCVYTVFGLFFSKKSISERLRGPSMPKIYFWKA